MSADPKQFMFPEASTVGLAHHFARHGAQNHKMLVNLDSGSPVIEMYDASGTLVASFNDVWPCPGNPLCPK